MVTKFYAYISIILFSSTHHASFSAQTNVDQTDTITKNVIKESTRYTAWNDLTVLDKKTGLLWEVKESTNRQKQYHWSDASKYCRHLVHGSRDNWHLPTIEELKTLLVKNGSNSNGTINSNFFPFNVPSNYWSSTEGFGHSGWYVDFDIGIDSNYDDSKTKYARCVTADSDE